MNDAARRPYHHGDLRSALLDRGVELARAGGPAAVQLRDAARRAGVSHNAGYRHFASREDYLDAVAARGMNALATDMESALRAVPAGLAAPDAARTRLSVLGRAYLDFALREPGLFRTAFATREGPDTIAAVTDARGPGGRNPYELLSDALDGLVAAGVLPVERRAHGEIVAWAAVHGLSALLLDGPLRGTPPAEVDVLWARVCDAALRGV